jgi:hypothetical protein
MIHLDAVSRFLSPLGVLTLVSLAFVGPASAQLALQRTGEGGLECAPLKPCTGDTDCMTQPGTVCSQVALPGGSSVPPGRFCVDPDGTRFCCAAPIDCPVRDGVRSLCLNPPSMTIDIGVCAYGDELDFDFCGRAADTLMRSPTQLLRDCFTAPMGTMTPFGTTPFAGGDCDGDGQANATDRCPCNPANTCERADAGPPETDASVVATDGGTSEVDGGVIDLGAVTPPMDAAATRGPDFRGGGGCACRAAPEARTTGTMRMLPAALLGGLVVTLRARRRRAR